MRMLSFLDAYGIFSVAVQCASAILAVVAVLVMIFFERAEQRTIAMWLTVMIFLPLAVGLGLVLTLPVGLFFTVAFFVYLCFGRTYYQKKLFGIKNVTDRQLAGIQAEAMEELNRQHMTPENEDGIRFAKSMLGVGGSTFSNNNDIKVYTLGEPFFEDFLEDLSKAEKFINVEYYIVRNDEVTNRFMDILIEKAKSGVEVRFMVDAIGFKLGPKRRMKEFKEAGGQFKLFHRAITVLLSPKKQNRNHRKITVIDGKIGYITGFNIGDEYMGKGELGFWRDTGVRVMGNGVIPVNARFFMDWGYATKDKLDANSDKMDLYFPIDEKAEYGNDIMQIISGGPDTKNNPIEFQYLKLINAAKNTLYIHTPYLVPSNEIQKALILSAASGVDVRIIMPDKPDHLFIFWASILHSGELMKHGVRIFQYTKGFVHSKTFVADGAFCSVGSANLDQRSMRLNFETNAMIYSKKIGEIMHNAFLEDLKGCEEYTLEKYDGLTGWEKAKISFARLFSSLA